ncbi:MAG: hypothetical protein U9R08_04590 [Nanoarchaeota archaeon]|nr:hypothetical protein [Nanoarchaeota archaeon]
MKEEISNKTLAILVIIAVIVSIGTTVTLLTRLDSGATGAATGLAKVDVTGLVAISLPSNTVDFGSVVQGYTADTTTNSPAPLTVQNDGGVPVNVSIERDNSSSALFSGTGSGDNTATFKFKIDTVSGEPNSFNYGSSTTSWTNVPGTTAIEDVITDLNYTNTNDIAEVDLQINVPNDEPLGSKNETLVFIAEQS